MERDALERLQLAKLNSLLADLLPTNRFYAEKFRGVTLPLVSLADAAQLPCTTKDELVDAVRPPANLTWPREQYVRYHETSGTRGRPLPVLDTVADWQWWIDCWQFVLDAAHITERDRAVLAFSFGPFIGFWSARDALAHRGALVVPGGGMSSRARLDLIRRTEATALFCTPTYALHLADEAASLGENLAEGSIRKIVVAGEPGGSTPSVRQRLETAWGARVIDHAGASEVGPWGYGDFEGRGVRVLETEFWAEYLQLDADAPAAPGELARLVVTALGRRGMPVIRYHTGDLVRAPTHADSGAGQGNRFALLEGGVLGRADDMMIVRGVNVFPSSIDEILRGFDDVLEYRLTVRKRGAMDELTVEVEDRRDEPQRIADELRTRLGLKVDVKAVAPQTLPRFEGKAKRFVDARRAGGAGERVEGRQ
jgi:phenylacetate-CoA ligase